MTRLSERAAARFQNKGRIVEALGEQLGPEARRTSPVIRMPIPPSNNHYKQHFCTRSITYGPNRDVHRVSAMLTKEATSFKEAAGWQAKQAGVEPAPSLTRVAMVVDVYQPIESGRRLDLDNVPKALFDALNGIAYNDDRQICEVHIYAHELPKKSSPYMEVQIIQKGRNEKEEYGSKPTSDTEHPESPGANNPHSS